MSKRKFIAILFTIIMDIIIFCPVISKLIMLLTADYPVLSEIE